MGTSYWPIITVRALGTGGDHPKVQFTLHAFHPESSGRRVHILEPPISGCMLQDLIGRQVLLQVEEGDGALRRAKTNLRGKVIHVSSGGGAPSTSSTSERVEVDLVNVQDESLRGGRLVLRPRLAGSSLEAVMEGRDVVVNMDLYLPHLGYLSKGIGTLLRVE
jgi:hypothetical protein